MMGMRRLMAKLTMVCRFSMTNASANNTSACGGLAGRAPRGPAPPHPVGAGERGVAPPLQFLEQRGNALRRVVGEEQVNSERARLDIAVRGEPVAERGKEIRCGRLIDAADEADAGGPGPLRRCGNDHPGAQHPCACEKRNEVPPFHSITSSARASNVAVLESMLPARALKIGLQQNRHRTDPPARPRY